MLSVSCYLCLFFFPFGSLEAFLLIPDFCSFFSSFFSGERNASVVFHAWSCAINRLISFFANLPLSGSANDQIIFAVRISLSIAPSFRKVRASPVLILLAPLYHPGDLDVVLVDGVNLVNPYGLCLCVTDDRNVVTWVEHSLNGFSMYRHRRRCRKLKFSQLFVI